MCMKIPKENKHLQTLELKNLPFTAGSLKKDNRNYPIKELFSKEDFSTLEGRDNRVSLWVFVHSRHEIARYSCYYKMPSMVSVLSVSRQCRNSGSNRRYDNSVSFPK